MQDLNRRIRSVLATLARTNEDWGARVPDFAMPERPVPDWLLLPTWLHEAWVGHGSRGPSDEMLADVLWGQYALFLYVRIHDDVLDVHREDLRLVFVADRFLVESLASFQRCRALGERFWTLYRDLLRETVEGVLEVHGREATPGGFAAEHLAAHARVGAIFKVAAAAVCHLHGRAEEIGWLSELQDRLAMFGQICDDFQDLPADLDGGRYTWVANVLLGVTGGEAVVAEERTRRLGQALLQPTPGAPIVEQLEHLARGADAAVPVSAPAAVRHLAQALHAKAESVAQAMHEVRVRWALGDTALGGPPRTRTE